MPGPVLHAQAVATCPHGVPLKIVAASPRVMVNNMAVAVVTDQGLVSGCPFTLPNGQPQPCVTTRWIAAATRVVAGGQPVLINPCTAMCLSPAQIPNGPPIISGSQMRVIAT
jgi:hypothetical protein